MSEDKVTYQLKKPIKYGSETITELVFREPKAKDFRAMPVEGQTIGHILDLAAKMCGQAPSVIDELSAKDLEGVSEIVEAFTDAGPETGKTQSE